MRLLVTGGAGYIGSVVAAQLADDGHDLVVLDDLSTGHADAVPAAADFRRGTIREDARPLLATGVDAVLHFAAKSLVAESVEHPARYWVWTQVSKLNAKHMQLAWVSLFWVLFTDLYIRLVAGGVFADPRFF